MSNVEKEAMYKRLEDFIDLAKEGKDVQVDVKLRLPLVWQQIHPEGIEDSKSKLSMCLFTGDFNFNVDGETKSVSKVYVASPVREHIEDFEIDSHVANERLRVDYQRLTDANIKFE